MIPCMKCAGFGAQSLMPSTAVAMPRFERDSHVWHILSVRANDLAPQALPLLPGGTAVHHKMRRSFTISDHKSHIPAPSMHGDTTADASAKCEEYVACGRECRALRSP
jgi:hypothetical protein